MNEKQLKEFVEDAAEFLRALDKAVPGRVDPDLVDFLEKSASNEFSLGLLQTMLPAKQDRGGGGARVRAV